jgi:heme/copper-type cytochrome/quinol oxidase subunit 2
MLQKNNNNNIRLQNKITILIIAVATTTFILFVNMQSNFINLYAQEQQQEQEKITNPSIELTAKLVVNEYRWIGSNNSTNPTLNITSGVDNQIIIKSIAGDQAEHQLIIEGVSDGGKKTEELISSDEIENGSSTKVNFNTSSDIDTNDYESFEYYCEYHPDTMIGKVQIK